MRRQLVPCRYVALYRDFCLFVFFSSLQTVRFGLFWFRSFVVLLRITYLVFPTKFLRISPDYSGYSTFIGMQDAVEVTYRPPHIFDLKSVHMMSLNFDHFMLLHTGSRPTGLIPMTHAPEIDAISQLHFSGAGLWHVCHANLEPDSSGTYQMPVPIRTLLDCMFNNKYKMYYTGALLYIFARQTLRFHSLYGYSSTAFSCVKGRHGRHLEIMTSYRKSDSLN